MISFWSPLRRHATPEEIHALVQGELSFGCSRRLRAHFDQCWTCRDEHAKVETAIRAFVSYRQSALVTMPDSTAGFLIKLQAAAAQPRPRSARPYLQYALATAALISVASLVFLRLEQIPTVSAAEVLRRVEEAESFRLHTVADPVVRQRLQIRRLRSGAVVSVSLAKDPALLELLAANRLTPPASLNGSIYRGFRPRADSESAREALSEGAVPIWLLDASVGSAVPGAVRSVSLSVRRADAHPIQETLTIQRLGFTEEFEIREVAYEIIPRSTFANAPNPRIAVPAVPAKTATVLPEDPHEDLDVVEVDLHYALHRIGACQGESITIFRDAPKHLTVEGVIDSPSRRTRIVSALDPWAFHRQVRLHLFTPSEVLAVQSGPLTLLGAQIFRRTIPVAGLLREVPTGQPAAEWMDQSLRASDLLLAEAFALRHLDDVFPRPRIASLPSHAQWLIEEMAEDHIEGLRTHLAALTAKLRLIPGWAPAPAVPATSPSTAAALLTLSRSISETVSGLIAAPQVTADETSLAVQSLGRQLPQLESAVAAYPHPTQP